MSCAPRAAEQIDAVHAAECLVCRRALEDQRALKAQLAQLRAPVLDRDRRRTLAAEVIASADLHDATRVLQRPRIARYVVGVLAVAAVVAVLVRSERDLAARVERRSVVMVDTPASPVAPAPAVPPLRVDGPPRPVVADEIASPVEEVESRVEIAQRKLDRARQVFGSTEKRTQAEIERDMLVEQTPIAAFRAGWEALREARYADAIAAFDRATDPAVAEDAAFWAAIAAQRAGQTDDARKRLDLFLTTFPASPRVEDARRAREVLR